MLSWVWLRLGWRVTRKPRGPRWIRPALLAFDQALVGLARKLGASGATTLDGRPGQAADRPLGGRVGPSVSRVPIGGVSPPGVPRRGLEPQGLQVRSLEPASVPEYGDLEVPGELPNEKAEGSLTLDAAIDLLLSQNLRILALRYEIPMRRRMF